MAVHHRESSAYVLRCREQFCVSAIYSVRDSVCSREQFCVSAIYSVRDSVCSRERFCVSAIYSVCDSVCSRFQVWKLNAAAGHIHCRGTAAAAAAAVFHVRNVCT